MLDELELTLVEQLLLLAVELELDLEHTEQVLQAVELGVDLLDELDVLDAEQVDLLDVEQVTLLDVFKCARPTRARRAGRRARAG